MQEADFQTPDLCDAHSDDVQVAEPLLRHFGGYTSFHGEIATVRVFEDNVLVRRKLEEPGNGRVLVVDGGGSVRCALMGDQVASLARDNGWTGLVINGCIRDSVEVGQVEVGVCALATCPRRSNKNAVGTPDIAVTFAGIIFEPGAYLYTDLDGMIVSPHALL